MHVTELEGNMRRFEEKTAFYPLHLDVSVNKTYLGNVRTYRV